MKTFLRLLRAAAPVVASSLALASPPPAPSEPVVDTLHGVRVEDPFRNLENLRDPRTRAWLEAQAAYGEAQLARIEGREALAQRVAELSKSAGDVVRDLRRFPGGRSYYLKRRAGENQFKLMLRSGAGEERVLVAPQQHAGDGVPHAINWYVPSWDGRTLAFGLSAAGSEDASLHLIDTASGKSLREPLPRVRQEYASFSPDSRRLTFNQNRELPAGAADTETYLDSTVYVIDVDRPRAAPRPIFGRELQPALGLERLDVGAVFFAPGSRWMVARTTDTTVPEGRLFVAPVTALASAKAIAWQPISRAEDQITDAQLRGDTLYLRTRADAPRGRLLALPLASGRPSLQQAREVVAEPAQGVLREFTLGRDAIYVEVQQGFNTRVMRHGRGTPRDGVDVAPGVAGTTFVVEDSARAYATPWVATSLWTEPPRVLAIDAKGGARDTGIRDSRRPAGTPELEVSEVMVESHDGARVPLAVIHRQGLARDGRNPTLLIGYGAYGFSFQAGFDPRSLAWFERGGVIALANVRGSGAFGDTWYRAGFKASKPNTWKDGLAAARWLIAQGYASPQTLGIWGTSAGGIFVGRAVTSAPELFAAAVFDVGVLDTVRFEESANGITNVSEFGTVKDPAEFRGLLEMSTYHQIRDGVAYPAVMLVHGMNDPRVDVWQSAKTAARLQQASASGKPVFMRIDMQAGHGVGSTAQQGASQRGDIYAFLLWRFGLLPARP
jgi:prolyl oligopeptidase